MDRVELVKFIRDKFNDSELRDLCFELHIDYESLPGEGKAAKARELVSFCGRRDRLPELERTARQMLGAETQGTASPLAPDAAIHQHGPLENKTPEAYPDQPVSGSQTIGGQGNGTIDDTARETASMQRQLAEARENLRLIEERKAEYVLESDVPLQIVKEERRLRATIAKLETKLRG